MKAYSTFAGAQRAANGSPIVRLLRDPAELWIPIRDLQADVMVYTAEGRRYEFAGRIEALEIASRDAD